MIELVRGQLLAKLVFVTAAHISVRTLSPTSYAFNEVKGTEVIAMQVQGSLNCGLRAVHLIYDRGDIQESPSLLVRSQYPGLVRNTEAHRHLSLSSNLERLEAAVKAYAHDQSLEVQ
jgi:hypothetical protein